MALGIALDAMVGEPPAPHPVAAFGALMRRVEGVLYADSYVRGWAHCAVGALVGAASGAALGSTAAASYLSIAQNALCRQAMDVHRALTTGDLDEARRLVPSLVGRDPTGLDPGELSRAAVESVAENTVDAIVAPALWAVVAGAPGVSAYRAVNTLDAMVGHRNKRYRRYGWTSARLDDLLNLVPARLTAALVAAARPRSALAVWRAVRQQAPDHPSPNAGVAEAAFAAALGLRLGGLNRYGDTYEQRPWLGTGRAPGPADIARAVALCREITVALTMLLLAIGCSRPFSSGAVRGSGATRERATSRRSGG